MNIKVCENPISTGSEIKPKGVFQCWIYNNGKLIEHYHDNNLVVTLGRENVAKLLAGDPDGAAITKVQLGTDDTPPALTDTAITNPFTKALSSVSFPSQNEVEFGFVINSNEANGMTISEFGLLNDNNILFARKTRTPIAKVAPMVIVGAWRIVIQ